MRETTQILTDENNVHKIMRETTQIFTDENNIHKVTRETTQILTDENNVHKVICELCLIPPNRLRNDLQEDPVLLCSP